MGEEAGDGGGFYLSVCGQVLGVEVKFPQISAAPGGFGWWSGSPQERTTELDQALVGDLPGEGDVEDGEPGAGVGHHPQQGVRGHMLHVERVETLAVGQAGSDQRLALRAGEEPGPASGPGTQPVRQSGPLVGSGSHMIGDRWAGIDGWDHSIAGQHL